MNEMSVNAAFERSQKYCIIVKGKRKQEHNKLECVPVRVMQSTVLHKIVKPTVICVENLLMQL